MKLRETREIREKIDIIDRKMLLLLVKRFKLVLKTKEAKDKLGLKITDSKREAQIFKTLEKRAYKLKLNRFFIKKLFQEIIKESKRLQKND